jgi:hypothetical protein
MTLITMLLSIYLGDQQITLETGELFIKTMRTAMAIFSVLAIAGVACSFARTKKY